MFPDPNFGLLNTIAFLCDFRESFAKPRPGIETRICEMMRYAAHDVDVRRRAGHFVR